MFNASGVWVFVCSEACWCSSRMLRRLKSCCYNSRTHQFSLSSVTSATDAACAVYRCSPATGTASSPQGRIRTDICFVYSRFKSKKVCTTLRGTHDLRATERHLPGVITQYHVPPPRHWLTRPVLTPASRPSTWFTYPGGRKGWVDLGGWLYTKIDCPSADSYPVRYLAGGGLPGVESTTFWI